MKKLLTIFFLSILTLSGCKKNTDIQIGDSVMDLYEQEMPFVFLGSLAVYKTDDTYTTIVSKNGVVHKIVEFTSDRECCTVQGLSLIKDGDINQYLGVNLNEVKKELGEVHADVGSGFYIPTYITENGYLVRLHVENDIIWAVEKQDVLTGEILKNIKNTGDGSVC